MQKAKKYEWKDTNLAMFGSDLDRQVKKEAAELEPAWKEVLECDSPNLFIWRIEKFEVVRWSSDLYGKFFNGDSYIILNAYKEDDEPKLCYDIHFWIGRHSTADEYGTAAYKTVELDTLLDDRPVQHREVQGHESDLFKSYFNDITYMSGGCPSGFTHVHTREYTPRLFHFRGERRNVIVKQVPKSRKSLDDSDVFILDMGDRAIQWNSAGSNKDERFKAAQYLHKLSSERFGQLQSEVIDQGDQHDLDEENEFYSLLNNEDEEDDSDSDDEEVAFAVSEPDKAIFRLSSESGKLQFEEVIRSASLSRSYVTELDVFVIDNGFEIFVYVGEDASPDEIKNSLTYAHNYLHNHTDPLMPVTVINAKSPGRTKAKFEQEFQ